MKILSKKIISQSKKKFKNVYILFGLQKREKERKNRHFSNVEEEWNLFSAFYFFFFSSLSIVTLISNAYVKRIYSINLFKIQINIKCLNDFDLCYILTNLSTKLF